MCVVLCCAVLCCGVVWCAGDGVDPTLLALLAAAGKSAGSLPPDMATALAANKVRPSNRSEPTSLSPRGGGDSSGAGGMLPLARGGLGRHWVDR